MVLEEEDVSSEALLQAVHSLYENRSALITAMEQSKQTDSIETITNLIEEAASHA